ISARAARLMIQYVCDFGINLVDAALSRHFMQQSVAAVVSDERFGVFVINSQALANRFLAVVIALDQRSATLVAGAGFLGRSAHQVVGRLADRADPAAAKPSEHLFV